MTGELVHGSIVGGLISTPDLGAAIATYRDRLGLRLVERGRLARDLAESWGAEASAGADMVTLQPQSGAQCFFRLVEGPTPPGFAALRTFGWAAFEITVDDVFALPGKLEGSGFEVVGPPEEIPELPYFIAMQVAGRGGEVLYLNQVAMDTPDSDLPKALSPVDRIFIAILAVPDREAAVAWYDKKLGLGEAARYELVYDLINRSFGLPADTKSVISLLQQARMPVIEVDGYPPAAGARPTLEKQIPPGNAMITLAVANLDGLADDFITTPVCRDGPVYNGARSGTVRGPAGELIELVEVG